MALVKVDVWNRALAYIGETEFLESETDDRIAAQLCDNFWDSLSDEVNKARPWPWATRHSELTEITTQDQEYTGDASRTQFEFTAPFVYSSQVKVYLTPSGGTETEQTVGTDFTITQNQGQAQQNYVTMTSAPASGTNVRIEVTTTRAGWDHIYTLPADFLAPIGFAFDDQRYPLMGVRSRLRYDILPNDGGDGSILAADVAATEFDLFIYVARIATLGQWSPHAINALSWRLAEPLARGLKKDHKLADSCYRRYLAALAEASALDQNHGTNDGVVEPSTPSLNARGDTNDWYYRWYRGEI